MKKIEAKWALLAISAILLGCSSGDTTGRSGIVNDPSCPEAPDAAVGGPIPVTDLPAGACTAPVSVSCGYITSGGCSSSGGSLEDWTCTCDAGTWHCATATEQRLSGCFGSRG
jgi:hypothetical protein